ncbi:hypothetical protein [Arthrobacter sp. H14-L1]|uniref:hypothetical protein n=1 Tax=Arthrobacter sp. H14-L1 TaxID=2996697 RepID=UPI00226FE122|nr:hypothetical protein [Arthrobacter sp. H14-L1]MCY0904028.1 hypothetical protein [Arthrobacter sp. H14-L1]
MTEQQFGADNGGGSRNDDGGRGRSNSGAEPAAGSTSMGAPSGPQASHALLGPLTLRDVVALGSVVVIFIGSVLPLFRADYYLNLWNGFSLFFLGIGVVLPLLTGILFLARRLSAGVKTRIGSLSVDQFGSVVASFATSFFFLYTVSDFRWAFLIGLIGSLGLLASTVVAPWLPFFAADFAHRPELPAHPVARDVVPAVAKPTVAKPAVVKPAVAKPAVAKPAVAKPAVATSVALTPDASRPGAAKGDADRSAAHEPAPTPSAAKTSSQPIPGLSHPAGSAAVSSNAVPSNAVGQDAVGQDAAGQGASVQHAAETAAPTPQTTLNPAVDTPSRAVPESIGATVDPGSRHEPDHSHDAGKGHGEKAVYDAFWFAVDRKRPVFDEKTGAFLYNVEPGSWILALRDRGHDFLVQNTEGRAGVLRDLSNIERAPESE